MPERTQQAWIIFEKLQHCKHYTFFVSRWIRDYHLEKGWACQSHSVAYNGVDMSHFKARKKLITIR